MPSPWMVLLTLVRVNPPAACSRTASPPPLSRGQGHRASTLQRHVAAVDVQDRVDAIPCVHQEVVVVVDRPQQVGVAVQVAGVGAVNRDCACARAAIQNRRCCSEGSRRSCRCSSGRRPGSLVLPYNCTVLPALAVIVPPPALLTVTPLDMQDAAVTGFQHPSVGEAARHALK